MKWDKINQAFSHYQWLWHTRADGEALTKAVLLCGLLADHIAGKCSEVGNAHKAASNAWKEYYKVYNIQDIVEPDYSWARRVCLVNVRQAYTIRQEIYQDLWNRA